MRKNFFTLLLFVCFSTIQVLSQTEEKTKEIIIKYDNGLELFNILDNDSRTNFDNEKEYYWYTEFSKIKSTKGGSGGKLLHGNYKFFDQKGNLIMSQNFLLGLMHGEFKKWDPEGELIEISKFEKADLIYWKYHPEDDNGWVEHIGRMLNDGWTKNSYNEHDKLVANQKTYIDPESEIKELKTSTIIYYPNTSIKKEEFTTFLVVEARIGKYVKYFDNGNIKVIGNLFDPYKNGINKYAGEIRDGTWKWYNKNGELEATEEYRAIVEYWSGDIVKTIYGQLFIEDEKKWINHGRQYSYQENGEGHPQISEYKLGELKEKSN